jgi:hypothetical protein
VIPRLLLVTALLSCGNLASADEDYSWCQGFIVKALGEFPVAGLSRTRLWLDWNTIVDETVVNSSLNPERYQAGRDHFSRLNAEGNISRIIETSEEDCAVGRSKLWAWW